MRYTRLIGTVIAFCMAVPLFAQQYKATIPYRIVGEKMVIEMKVNGNARPFIFDTGGRTALTTKASQALQITATDSMKVTDVNNVESYYQTTRPPALFSVSCPVYKGRRNNRYFPALSAHQKRLHSEARSQSVP